jgi:hypothetical protein
MSLSSHIVDFDPKKGDIGPKNTLIGSPFRYILKHLHGPTPPPAMAPAPGTSQLQT